MSVLKNKIFIKSIPIQKPANPLKGIPVGTFKIAAKLNLKKGKRYQGTTYVEMMNNALLTNIGEGYIKSSYSLDHIGLYDALAWFAFFDGNYRRSGKDGEYMNQIISNDEILETCLIENENEYKKKRSACRTIRFVFSRGPSNSCNFEGIFYQESINIYEANGKLIGETVLKRYADWEQYL